MKDQNSTIKIEKNQRKMVEKFSQNHGFLENEFWRVSMCFYYDYDENSIFCKGVPLWLP